MRHVVLVAIAVIWLAPRTSDACVQLAEANKLLGWSADGTLALHARVDAKGVLEHAEIHPTRFEGWKYLIVPDDDATGIVVKKVAVGACDVIAATEQARVKTKLTLAALDGLAIVKAMKLVAVPSDDGGAGKLAAAFTPAKRHAEHQLELRDGTQVLATLPVPVWCVGSCLRDEDFASWSATVRTVAKAGDRTLYIVRMKRVCNAGNDKDMWIDRVIAVPGTEPKPKFGRCKGSG